MVSRRARSPFLALPAAVAALTALTAVTSCDRPVSAAPSEASLASPAGQMTGHYKQMIGYYNQWDVYNRYYVKDLVTSGAAAKLTTLDYAFENIDGKHLTCSESDNASGTSAGDARADYQLPFSAANSVDGKADTAGQRLAGNFNQLRELKASYPKLKVLVSIGGWDYSKYFSDAAATASSRRKFVSSCISMFLKGNLPTGIGGDSSGGAGAAAGIFDGFDIDWEYPAAPGYAGNHYGPRDTANYTALLAEFRGQLNALGATAHRHYLLTAAVPPQPANMALLQVSKLGGYLDFADVMTYDMHGPWEPATNFQAPLYSSPNDPAGKNAVTVAGTVSDWISGGFPASKLVLGVPFYWQGWAGVTAGGSDGLYQAAAGPSAPFPVSAEAGNASYSELEAAGEFSHLYWDPATSSAWVFDGTNFYSGETPRSLAAKMSFVRAKGLAGAMIYSLDDDDQAATLSRAVATGLGR